MQAPPPKSLPSHPSPRLWLGSLAGDRNDSKLGIPWLSTVTLPVRLFDRAARPIITPHARLLYFMSRVVLYHAESEACPRPKVP